MADVMSFTQSLPAASDDQGLWVAIRNRTEAIQFSRYQAFLEAVFCGEKDPDTSCEHIIRPDGLLAQRDILDEIGYGTAAYKTLRAATEVFLLLNTGVYVHRGTPDAGKTYPGYTAASGGCATAACQDAGNLGSSALLKDDLVGDEDPNKQPPSPTSADTEEAARMPNQPVGSTDSAPVYLDVNHLKQLLTTYLSDSAGVLPYLDRIAKTLSSDPYKESVALCSGLLTRRVKCPLMIELLWNYWHEAGGQIQTMKSIALRFQNRRICDARDPLADLDIDPLRPLGNILWGYIQDETNQLSVLRRSYEYDHHYGISLKGRAIPRMCTADSRSKFLAGFHTLLRLALTYYKAAENAYKIPDGFPMLNGLKEVHLLLAEGAGNQFGDLPWQSRVEMLMEQWILGRDEMREFLNGRTMVPYPAEFMGRVDVMRKLQGWGDTSFRYFYELAVFGERLLLSVRYGDWSVVTSEDAAKNWANYWRQEIQGYVHAYRVVTGVDLADTRAEPETLRRIVTPPQELIRMNGDVSRRLSPAAANGRG